MSLDISIIIPTYNCRKDLDILLESLENQILKPAEVVVSDSSDDGGVENLLRERKGNLSIVYIKNNKRFPGEKRNLGVKSAKHKWIAFLDVGTVPKNDWLEKSSMKVLEGFDVIFGLTKYKSLNSFQNLLRAATFGRIGHETSPGTLISKDNFILSGGFVENVRAGDDLDWRQQLRDLKLKCFTPKETSLEYSSLPERLYDMQKKYFIYYLHSGKFRAQRNTRYLYLSALLILSALIVTRWNYLIDGWSENPFFIPHITKIYIISILVFSISYISINRFFYKVNQNDPFTFVLKIFSFFLLSGVIFYWNANIAKWVEDSALYIPHITKIYIAFIFFASIFYRGIHLPLKLAVPTQYLFPARWLLVGFIGLSLDLVKIPGTLLGLFLAPFQRNRSKKI